MNTSSIRWRLPLTYAGIALLTALVLGSMLFLALRRSYSHQESDYLTSSAQLMSPGITRFLENQPSSPALQQYIQNLSFLVQARIRILNRDDQEIADSGSLRAQQFIYTNLTPSGMSADVFREGKAERYLYYVGIHIMEEAPAGDQLGDYSVFLSQLPTENSLCGFGAASPNTKTLQRTEQVIRFPLTGSDGELVGTILVSEGLAFGSKIIISVAQAWAYASLVAVLVAVGSGWWISRRLVAPLSDLTQATQQMAAGVLSTRAQVDRRDEFGALGRSFNAMAERVEEIVATLRSFVADAAHELHTPLTTLRVNLDLAADDPHNLADYLPPAQDQINRLQALVDSLLDLSRIEAGNTEQTPFSLSGLLKEIAEKYSRRAQEVELAFSSDLSSEEVVLVADAAQIRRALENILDNAIKFTSPPGSVTLTMATGAQEVIVRVKDTGIGIPLQDQPKLFQRFHRGRNVVDYPGSGLGLAIVKAIVDQHRGKLVVQSDSDGTCVTVVIPIQ